VKKYLKLFQSKILLPELRFRHAVKKLPFRFKIAFLALLAIFIVNSLILLHEVDKKISTTIPDSGGLLREGIVGTPRFVNPVLTISDADRDLSMLIYSGLLRADANQLILDMAESYEVSEDGLCYAFKIKPDIFWPDRVPITSDDVIFTIEQIKNPLSKSPKRASWEGVSTEKIDEKTIQFCLQKPYAPFPENATVGILPQHIWKDMLPEQMPLSDFNIKPMGSGPYKIEKISRSSSGIITSYTLAPNESFALQKPYIEKLIFKFYHSEKKLIEAYQQGEIDDLSAVSPKSILEIKRGSSFLKTYLLPRVFAVFFNQDSAAIFAEQEVRQALNLSVNKELIVNEVLQNFGETINSPIPPGSLGSISAQEEKSPEERLAEAKNLLANRGWKINEKENVLEKKKGKETLKLEFSISTSNVPDLVQAAELLKQMWGEIGAKVQTKVYEIGDLEQDVLRPRKYDALLFGEIMGRDPDAFAFWHSSQRNDPGLNIALYANIKADKLLEEARTTSGSKKREDKYREFQKEVIKDSPAVFLYSPYFICLVPDSLKGIDSTYIAISSERFSQIYKWYLKTKKVWKIFSD